MKMISRREFLGISTKASAATFFAGTLAPTATSFLGMAGVAEASTKKVSPFNFAVISDAHLYNIKDHRFDGILERAVNDVNAMSPRPDFVIFGGDLAQTGMKAELEKGKRILDRLKVPLKIIPGEHDWYLDMGKTWGQMFGKIPWSFDHKGVHFIGMNSILIKDFWTAKELTPEERMDWVTELECHRCGLWGVRDEQLDWLAKDVKNLSPDTPVVVFTHSPLWDYYPRWNFQTEDAPEIHAILRKFEKVIAIHGHVHQVVYNKIGNMSSAGLLSTSWPWPYPPIALPYPQYKMNRVDPADFYDGLGPEKVAIGSDFAGMMDYRAWSDLLPDVVKRGLPL